MADFMRTCTPEGDYRSFEYTIESGVTKIIGTLYIINDTWAITFASEDNHLGGESVGSIIVAGKKVTMIYNCEKIMVAKAAGSGTAISVGEKVYVDHAVKDVYNTNAVDRTCIGICVRCVGDDAEEVMIDLKGDSMTDQA